MQIPLLLDAHVHLRIGEMLRAVVPIVARYCQAAIIMPNTANIRTGAQAKAHRNEIVAIAEEAGFPGFRPLMTVMLTDDTDPADIASWPDAGVVAGKYYPADLYPHGGVSDIGNINDVLQEMWWAGIPISGHFEKAGIHPLLAEQAAIPDFRRIADRGNVTVFEHASTVAAIAAVKEYVHAAATITPQHLWLTADDVYDESRENIIYPHNWCRPVAKTAEDRQALIEAATNGIRQFFFGSDFAPHSARMKAQPNPPAGCACYPAGPAILAAIFKGLKRLHRLENFTSGFASIFYGQTMVVSSTLTIVDEASRVPFEIPFGSEGEAVIPWLAGELLPHTVTSL